MIESIAFKMQRRMTQVKKDMAVLGIREEAKLTANLLYDRYKAQAKVHHPDRPTGNTEAFQALHNAYLRLCDNIDDNLLENAGMSHVKEFFKKSNFPQEKTSCFVVLLEKKLSSEWD